MATRNRLSVATISSPEFINIEGISPFASKCEIKVLYLGGNRNGSFISKDVAIEMAQTLPGCPIVGYFSENVDDFRDHGDQMIIDGEGVKFKCLTKPYGFVAPTARVWFQDFQDTDEFGNSLIRTYLMTEGYLWTKQYKEAQKVINEGRPQSMELDEDTLKGYWSEDVNRGLDFFIINDAIFEKLCILGQDVEPCFEGASVTAPKISSAFTKDENFVPTLFTMMKELKELTLNNKGGKSMSDNTNYVAVNGSETTPVIEDPVVEPIVIEPTPVVEENIDISLDAQDKADLENNIENEDIIEDFAKKNPEEDEKDSEDSGSEDADNENKEDEEDEKKKTSKNTLEEKFALLEQQFTELEAKCKVLEEENSALVAFKAKVEDEKKDELIASFYMLSDEDKKSVIENKANYTLDDIEKELSVICVRKRVNFNLDEENTTDEKEVVPTTYNINEVEDDNLPPWLKAVEARKNAENI